MCLCHCWLNFFVLTISHSMYFKPSNWLWLIYWQDLKRYPALPQRWTSLIHQSLTLATSLLKVHVKHWMISSLCFRQCSYIQFFINRMFIWGTNLMLLRVFDIFFLFVLSRFLAIYISINPSVSPLFLILLSFFPLVSFFWCLWICTFLFYSVIYSFPFWNEL